MILKLLIFGTIANFALACRSNTDLNLSDSQPFVPSESNSLRTIETFSVKTNSGVALQIQKNTFSDNRQVSVLMSLNLGQGNDYLVNDEPPAAIMGLLQTTSGAAAIQVSVKPAGVCDADYLNALKDNADGTFSKTCLLLYTVP